MNVLVQEKGVVRLSILDEPLHRPEDIVLGRHRPGILLVVCEDDHVLGLVAETFRDEHADVVHLLHQLPSITRYWRGALVH